MSPASEVMTAATFVAPNLIRENNKNLDEHAELLGSQPKEVQEAAKKALEDAPDELFALQTKGWVAMQGAVKMGLSLPINEGDFTEKYGLFESKTAVEDCLAILVDINALLQEFGDPTSIAKEIDKYTSLKTPPNAIFAHSVWISLQTQLAAELIKDRQHTLLRFVRELSIGQQVEAFQEIVIGKHGIRDQAAEMENRCRAFSVKLGDYYQRLFEKLKGKNQSLKSYLDESDNVYDAAKRESDKLSRSLCPLRAEANDLNTKWIAFTSTAAASPAACVVPPLFFFNTIIIASVFGPLAGKYHAMYEEKLKEIQDAKEDEKKKNDLVAHLGQFNHQAQIIDEKGTDFLDAVGKMTDGWATLQTELTKLAANITPDTLQDLGNFGLIAALEGANTQWDRIAEGAKRFRASGFLIELKMP